MIVRLKWSYYMADHLGPLVHNRHAHAKNLDLIFDPALKFNKHIDSVVKGFLFLLRNITSLSLNDCHKHLNSVTARLL